MTRYFQHAFSNWAFFHMQDFPEGDKMKNITVKFVDGEPGNAENLMKAGTHMADSIIVGSILDSADAKQADALTVALIMLIQEVLATSGRDKSNSAHIIGMVIPSPPPPSWTQFSSSCFPKSCASRFTLLTWLKPQRC